MIPPSDPDPAAPSRVGIGVPAPPADVRRGFTDGALSGALAQTKAGVTAADKQLTARREGRTKSLEAQDKQQAIADAGKAAGKATADPIRLKEVANVKVVAAPASVTRVDGIRAATLTASSESANLSATTAADHDRDRCASTCPTGSPSGSAVCRSSSRTRSPSSAWPCWWRSSWST